MQLLDPNAIEIGFQVEALIGYYNSNNVFVGQSSGWSNTQTVNIPASSTSPTPTLTVPELSRLVIVPLLLSLFSVAVLIRHGKTISQNKPKF